MSSVHIYDDLFPTEARTSRRTTNLGYENAIITTGGTNTDSHNITDGINKSSKNSKRPLILFCGGLITGLVIASIVVFVAMKYGNNYSVDPSKQCGNIIRFHIFCFKCAYMWWFFYTISFDMSFCCHTGPHHKDKTIKRHYVALLPHHNDKTTERESFKYRLSFCRRNIPNFLESFSWDSLGHFLNIRVKFGTVVLLPTWSC